MTEQLGLELKEHGMEQARQAYDVQTWKARFAETVEEIAARGLPFTSEDVLARIGLPREAKMNANNAVGAMMNAMAKKGVIQKTTERRQAMRYSSHGRELAVWIRAMPREDL